MTNFLEDLVRVPELLWTAVGGAGGLARACYEWLNGNDKKLHVLPVIIGIILASFIAWVAGSIAALSGHSEYSVVLAGLCGSLGREIMGIIIKVIPSRIKKFIEPK